MRSGQRCARCSRSGWSCFRPEVGPCCDSVARIASLVGDAGGRSVRTWWLPLMQSRLRAERRGEPVSGPRRSAGRPRRCGPTSCGLTPPRPLPTTRCAANYTRGISTVSRVSAPACKPPVTPLAGPLRGPKSRPKRAAPTPGGGRIDVIRAGCGRRPGNPGLTASLPLTPHRVEGDCTRSSTREAGLPDRRGVARRPGSKTQAASNVAWSVPTKAATTSSRSEGAHGTEEQAPGSHECAPPPRSRPASQEQRRQPPSAELAAAPLAQRRP